jgi:hypothetical protein
MSPATTATALNAGRIAVGLAFLLSPSSMGRRWFGTAAETPGGQVAVRAFGVRDAALGAATIGTLRATGVSGTGFAVLAGLGIAVDVVDAAATLAAWRALPGSGRAVAGVALGAAAAGASVLASRSSAS